MTVTLWHIEVSHYNEKARWALEYKGVPYRARAPLPAFHRLTALRLTRGRHQRLPIARIDGRIVADSTAIIAALEDYAPDPALYPADPTERARALELEDYFDEQLAPRVRRFLWQHTLDDPDATVDSVFQDRSQSLRRGLMRAAVPLARPLVKRDYGVSDEEAAEAVEGIRAVAERIERELRPSGYLAGEAFSVADLTGAALFTPLIGPPERPYLPPIAAPVRQLREEIESRDAGAWVTEMYARHRGRAAAPA